MTAGDLHEAQELLNARVLGRPGVEGTAIGQRNGEPCLKVYVSTDSAGRSIPGEIRGIPVVIEASGSFRPR